MGSEHVCLACKRNFSRSDSLLDHQRKHCSILKPAISENEVDVSTAGADDVLQDPISQELDIGDQPYFDIEAYIQAFEAEYVQAFEAPDDPPRVTTHFEDHCAG
jgi:hypothetical protein